MPQLSNTTRLSALLVAAAFAAAALSDGWLDFAFALAAFVLAIAVAFLIGYYSSALTLPASDSIIPPNCPHPPERRFATCATITEGPNASPVVIVGCARCGAYSYGKQEDSK